MIVLPVLTVGVLVMATVGVGDAGDVLQQSVQEARHALQEQQIVVLGEAPVNLEEALELSIEAMTVEEPEPSQMLSTGPGSVVGSWQDSAGRTVLLRAVPRNKIYEHNLNVWTTQRVTQLAPRQFEGGTSYKYETYAREYSCSWWSCTVLRQQLVRVVINLRRLDVICSTVS